MSGILETIAANIIAAMKAHDQFRVDALRLAKSELQKAKIDKGDAFTEDEAQAVLRRELKRRHEAATAYKGAGRGDLADKELKEGVILEEFLPKNLSPEEIETVIAESVKESGAASVRDMGRLMKIVMPRLKGRADGNLVRSLVEKALNAL